MTYEEAEFVLSPTTLSEKWAFEDTPASKSQDSARVWGSQEYKEGKHWALNPCCQQKSRQRRHASENHIQELCRVEKACDALSFKATWSEKVIFTSISALSWLLLAFHRSLAAENPRWSLVYVRPVRHRCSLLSYCAQLRGIVGKSRWLGALRSCKGWWRGLGKVLLRDQHR